MKPRVFLSHSKADRDFIERVANDLRGARIDAWLDEWEIPPGESFRRHLFEEGIPNCDLVFVYLSPASAASYWVSRELDAAMVRDAEARGGVLALFVDADDTRKALSLDLQALHSPVFSREVYERPLRQLIARCWEARLRQAVRQATADQQLEVVTLQKTVAELEARMARMELAGASDLARVHERLTAVTVRVKSQYVAPEIHGESSLAEVFRAVALILASGTWQTAVQHRVGQWLLPEAEHGIWMTPDVREVLGLLIVEGLVRVVSGGPEGDDYYYLTERGIALAARYQTPALDATSPS